jgi:hypothetical protein
MQNEKIEDDFLQARNLTKAMRLIADSITDDDWLNGSLYGLANAMENTTDAIATKFYTTKSKGKKAS